MKNILAISLVLFSTLAFADNHAEESSLSSTFSGWWDKTKELGSAIWSETKETTAETAEKVENSDTYQSIKTESSNLYEKAKQQFSSEPRMEPAPVK